MLTGDKTLNRKRVRHKEIMEGDSETFCPASDLDLFTDDSLSYYGSKDSRDEATFFPEDPLGSRNSTSSLDRFSSIDTWNSRGSTDQVFHDVGSNFETFPGSYNENSQSTEQYENALANGLSKKTVHDFTKHEMVNEELPLPECSNSNDSMPSLCNFNSSNNIRNHDKIDNKSSNNLSNEASEGFDAFYNFSYHSEFELTNNLSLLEMEKSARTSQEPLGSWYTGNAFGNSYDNISDILFENECGDSGLDQHLFDGARNLNDQYNSNHSPKVCFDTVDLNELSNDTAKDTPEERLTDRPQDLEEAESVISTIPERSKCSDEVAEKFPPKDNGLNNRSWLNLFDETLDPDLEKSLQRCLKITRLLTTDKSDPAPETSLGFRSAESQRHFNQLRSKLKRKFIVPPKTQEKQPMISRKSVHYKWRGGGGNCQPPRTETIHFATYPAVKKKNLKNVSNNYQTSNLKSKILDLDQKRKCPLTKELSLNTRMTNNSKLSSSRDNKLLLPAVKQKDSGVIEKDHSTTLAHNFDKEPSFAPASKLVLPVGRTGCSITVPSSVPVNMESFSPGKPFEKPRARSLSPEKVEVNKQDYIIESTITHISDLAENAGIRKNSSLEMNSGTAAYGCRSKSKFKPILNSENVVKIQIYTLSPKQIVVTRVKCPTAKVPSPDKGTRIAARSNWNNLIRSILSRFHYLTPELVKQICLPVNALQRGFLTDAETKAIVQQVTLLQELSELTSSHDTCQLSSACELCARILKKREELEVLQKWNFQPVYFQNGNANNICRFRANSQFQNLSSEKLISSNQQSQNSKCGSWPIQSDLSSSNSGLIRTSGNITMNNKNIYILKGKNHVKALSKTCNVNVDDNNNDRVNANLEDQLKLSHTLKDPRLADTSKTNLTFYIRRLDIGKFCLLSSNGQNAVKVTCDSKLIVYEIHMQSNKNEQELFVTVQVPCQDIIGVNIVNNVLTFEMKAIPILTIFDICRNQISRDKVKNHIQASLLMSLKNQLSVYFLHKLFLQEKSDSPVERYVSEIWPHLKLTFNTEEELLKRSYFEGRYSSFTQREKRQKHLEKLLGDLETFLSEREEERSLEISGCNCLSGCRSPMECWCCHEANECTNCSCLSCENPLHDLRFSLVNVEAAKLDVCLMQNIYDLKIQDLKNILNQVHILPCCGALMKTFQLIPNLVECLQCKESLSYSWCKQQVFVEKNKSRNHCILCFKCQPTMYMHCSDCSKCMLASSSGKCTICMC